MLTVRIALVNRGGLDSYEIEVEESHMPDPDQRFFFHYHQNAYTDDKIQVEFSKEGYLKRLSTTVEDKTGEIIEKVLSAGEEVVKATTFFRGEGARVVYEATIDPFDAASLERVHRDLGALKIDYRLEMVPLRKREDTPAAYDASAGSLLGVFCRPQEPFEVIVKKGDMERRKLVMLHHPDLIHFIELPAVRFVSTSFVLECNESGYPVKMELTKPSQALAAIDLPLKVLRALIALPSKLFQFRINYNNEKAQVAESDKKYEALMKQMKEQENLAEEVKMQKEATVRLAQKLEARS